MKRVLSLVLVLVLVLGAIVPAFAEETVSQATTDLQAYGVIANADEATPLTRAQMAVLYARLQGKGTEAEAHALPTTLTDLTEGAWYVPWVSYVAEQEWMVGSDNMFRPDENISAKEAKVLLLKALGHEVVWDTVDADAEAAGIVFEAADATLPLRGEVFAAVRAALDMTPVDGTETLGTVLALTDYVAPVVEEEVVDLAVESVTALNAKEIEVVFNKEITAPVAADFEVKDKGTTIIAATPSLSEDKMTVTLTMDALTALTNSTNAKVTVKTTVKDADAVKLAAAYVDSAVTVFDGTFPTATAIKAVGSKALEITFSEPVYDGTDLSIATNEFKVKSGTYTYSVTAADVVGNTLTVKTGTTLQEGDIVVTYNNAATPTIQDFAGNKAFKGEITLAYAKDTSAPTATVKSITQTEVV
jgi:hypothetical protein